MFASTRNISSHQIASETLRGTPASVSIRPLSDEVLSRPIAAPHSGKSQPIPPISLEVSREHERSGSHLAPTSPLLTSRPVSLNNSKVEDHSSSCRGMVPGRLSTDQMTYIYTGKLRCLVDGEVCDVPTPCKELSTDHTIFKGTWSLTEPATLGPPISEVDLLSSAGESGELDARRDLLKRKPSAAELFPRTNYQDKEECWDESGFLGLETDEILLEEMGEELVNARDESQEQNSRVCSDPCWR